MKKNKIKRKVALIVVSLFVIFAISPLFNVAYADLNDNVQHFGGDGAANEIVGTILNALGLGVLGSALSAVVLLVVGLLVLILSAIFGPLAGTWGFPGMDTIVFNGVAIFDPNFINPPDSKYVALTNLTTIQDLIKSVYQTGYVIGGSIFVIGAMIIGIKLAVTSIASEKAYYKEMIGTWLKGLVLMFTVHIIITAVFSLNEMVVSSLSTSVTTISFSITWDDLGPAGKVVGGIVSFFGNLFGQETSNELVTMYGIEGLMWKLVVRGLFDGDLISAIAVAGIIGQTCSLMITYFKRVIVCILLAAIAPYIVAVDFLKQLI